MGVAALYRDPVRLLARFVVTVVAGGAGLVLATLALIGPTRSFLAQPTATP